MTFHPGDVVMLKSGGHSMTVVAAEEEDIDCLWVGEDGQMFRQSIPAVALTVVESMGNDETDDMEEEEETEDEDDEDDDEEHEDEDDEEESGKKRAKRR